MRTIILLLLLAFSSVGFLQTNQKYEYLTMIQYDNIITLSKSSGSFEVIEVKSEKSKYVEDHSPLLKRIEKYEEEGWELFSNNVYSSGDQVVPRNYVLMKRKK